MAEALQVSGRNIFCSTNVEKNRKKRISQIVDWSIELPPNQMRPAGPSGWIYWCMSARSSKGQLKKKFFLYFWSSKFSKISFPSMCSHLVDFRQVYPPEIQKILEILKTRSMAMDLSKLFIYYLLSDRRTLSFLLINSPTEKFIRFLLTKLKSIRN